MELNKINRIKINLIYLQICILCGISLNIFDCYSNIIGPNSSCIGETKRYRSTIKNDNIWEVNGGYIVKNYSDSLDVMWLETYGTNIKLKHLNTQSGTYDSYQLNVAVSQKSKPKISGISSICANNTASYSYSFPVSGFQPNWSVTNGQIISGQNTNNVNIKWTIPGGGRIILTNTNPNICYTPDTFKVSVIFLPNMQIFGRENICKAIYETFSIDYSDKYSYYWESKKGKIYGSASQNEVSIVWDNPGVDSLKVTVYNNQSNCSRQYSKQVIINDFPKVQLQQFDDICNSGDMLKLTGGTPEGGTYGGGYYVVDGYFNVAFAGVGKHIITYSYTNKNGLCTGTDQKYITVLKIPQKPYIYYENSVLYTNLNSGIQWYFNDKEIPGANQKTYHPDRTGKYSLTGENELGCRSEMSSSIYVDLANIEDFTLQNYKVIKNQNELLIKCKNEILEAKMYNLLGECEYETKPNSNQVEINLLNKTEAIYFVQLILQNGESIFIKYIR